MSLRERDADTIMYWIGPGRHTADRNRAMTIYAVWVVLAGMVVYGLANITGFLVSASNGSWTFVLNIAYVLAFILVMIALLTWHEWAIHQRGRTAGSLPPPIVPADQKPMPSEITFGGGSDASSSRSRANRR